MPSRSKRSGASSNFTRVEDRGVPDSGPVPPPLPMAMTTANGFRGLCQELGPPGGPADGWAPLPPAACGGGGLVPAALDKDKHSEIFMKTKMCKFHILGMCAKGPDCQFAHSMEEMNPLPDLYRTKLCKSLINTGQCDNPTCKYAHNKVELRTANMNRSGGGGGGFGGRANAKVGRNAKQRGNNSNNCGASGGRQPVQDSASIKAPRADYPKGFAPSSGAGGGGRGNDAQPLNQMPPLSMVTANGEQYPVMMHPTATWMPECWFQPPQQDVAWTGHLNTSQAPRAPTTSALGRSPTESPSGSTRSERQSDCNSNSLTTPSTPPPKHLYCSGGPEFSSNNGASQQWYARSGETVQLQQLPHNPGQRDDNTPMMPHNGQWLTCIQAPPDADDFFNNGNGITIKNTFLEIGCCDQPPRPLHKVATAGGRLELLAEVELGKETPRGVACF